jgi:hypothetical protein
MIAQWTAGKVIVGHLPMSLFAVSIALQGVCTVAGVVLVCSNMHHLFNYLFLAVTLGGLMLASQITPHFGFPAVPATMVLQDTSLVVIAMVLCRSKLHHVTLIDVGSVFTFAFYRKHLRATQKLLTLVSSK